LLEIQISIDLDTCWNCKCYGDFIFIV